ncbi:MAG: hypothetical protein ICV83_04095 [Cytophagales bacterium]|nr:hypothetical protein [Cytophagales bacterium]
MRKNKEYFYSIPSTTNKITTMTYRDNEVRFSLGGGYTVVGGSYTVNSCSITEGQDPKGHITKGMNVPFGSNGTMSFSIGRQGSESVANWFNTQVKASQTTFNHPAGELNFAFLGTLALTLLGPDKNQDTYTFLNVALAQGHAGTSNNWWFGGKNCSNQGDNRVTCSGTNTKGGAVYFSFLRGGNDVNEVGVTKA